MKIKTESVNVEPSAEHHFYAYCVYGWATSSTAHGALSSLVEAFDHNFSFLTVIYVIKVDLPESSEYDINMFVPVVDKDKLEYVVETSFNEVDEALKTLRNL